MKSIKRIRHTRYSLIYMKFTLISSTPSEYLCLYATIRDLYLNVFVVHRCVPSDRLFAFALLMSYFRRECLHTVRKTTISICTRNAHHCVTETRQPNPFSRIRLNSRLRRDTLVSFVYVRIGWARDLCKCDCR